MTVDIKQTMTKFQITNTMVILYHLTGFQMLTYLTFPTGKIKTR